MLKYLWLVLLLPHSFCHPATTVRPYKFAFNIKGYQHRIEEKDENGIIKGEYGFITADGYYRTTVYATDEKGKFHIVSTNNTYVGFPPDDPVTTTKSPVHNQGNQRLQHTFGSNVLNTEGQHQGAIDRATESPKTFTRPQGIAACSDCFIPTKPPPRQHDRFNGGVPGGGNFGSSFGRERGRPGQPPKSPLTGNVKHLPQRGSARGAAGGSAKGPPRSPARGTAGGFATGSARGPMRGNAGGLGEGPERGPSTGPQRGHAGGHEDLLRQKSLPSSENDGQSFKEGNQLGPDGRVKLNPVSGGFGPSRGGNKLTHNQLGNALPSGRPHTGEVIDGLPPGVNLADISDLLYSFNYTVGDYGQHEDGYRNGDKIGDYYFVSDKGIKHDIEYVANEFGYQPNITYTRVHKNDGKPYEQSDNELKGYEFKWFYRK